jgi:hypothetical protein
MRRPITALLTAALTAALMTAPMAVAQAQVAAQAPANAMAGAGPAWAELTLAQQAALTPLKAHWTRIDANGKAKWIAVARSFPGMPAEERQRVQARMAEWTAMTPTERGRARQNFQELRNLPGEDRQALWEAYRALPPEQRQELAQRARPATAPRPATDQAQPTARRVVPVNPPPPTVKPVTPTVVQVKPGATTTLVSKPASPPLHNQPGLPKIAATPGFVHPQTLLPKRGPQGAATVRVPAEPARPPAAAAVVAPAAATATSAAAAAVAPPASVPPAAASAASSAP